LIVTIIDPAACSTVAVTVAAAGAAVWCQWEETDWLTELQQLPWI